MNKEFEVDIFSGNTKVGELMTATVEDLIKYIHKGMTVIEKCSGSLITEEMLTDMMGVSDGCACL